MRASTSRGSARAGKARLVGLLISPFLLAAIQPAFATTWGHLRSPFSAESEQRERANLAAEERAGTWWQCGWVGRDVRPIGSRFDQGNR